MLRFELWLKNFVKRSSRKRPLSQAIMTTFGIRCSTRPFLVSGHSATTQSLIHIIQHLNETVHCGNGSLIKIFHSAVWQLYTAISRKVVGKDVHATIPKGNMGYDRYTVSDNCSFRSYFCCFPLAVANTFSWPFLPILSNFSEEQWTQNHPQCLSGLSRALFPTTLLEKVVTSRSFRSDLLARLFSYELLMSFWSSRTRTRTAKAKKCSRKGDNNFARTVYVQSRCFRNLSLLITFLPFSLLSSLLNLPK